MFFVLALSCTLIFKEKRLGWRVSMQIKIYKSKMSVMNNRRRWLIPLKCVVWSDILHGITGRSSCVILLQLKSSRITMSMCGGGGGDFNPVKISAWLFYLVRFLSHRLQQTWWVDSLQHFKGNSKTSLRENGSLSCLVWISPFLSHRLIYGSVGSPWCGQCFRRFRDYFKGCGVSVGFHSIRSCGGNPKPGSSDSSKLSVFLSRKSFVCVFCW